jgi:hypothetical protein
MRAILSSIALAFVFALGTTASAQEKAAEKPAKAEKAAKPEKAADKAEKKGGEVTLAGDIVCGKCALHETQKCQNVLKVTDAGKETKYYLADNPTAKENHVCSGAEKATVRGTVAEEGGKKVLTASEIKFASAKKK